MSADRLLEWLGKVPTTQARMVTTLAVFAGTAAWYWVTKQSPSVEWLGFLLAMSGLDVSHFASKRLTDVGYVEAKNGNGNGNGAHKAPDAPPSAQ